MVSVPTVFRQDEMDRDLVARHAVLFGVYAVVLLAMLDRSLRYLRTGSPHRCSS